MASFIKPEGLSLNFYELLITEKCDSNCAYCFDNYFTKRNNKTALTMQKELIPDIISFIKKTSKNNSPLRINFIGGEPLVNFSFLTEATKILHNEFSPLISFSINTNILQMSQEIIDFFRKYNFDITTSVDGLQENHDKFRGNWNKVILNLVSLVSAYKDSKRENIGIIFVINPETVQTLVRDFLQLADIYSTVKFSINAEAPWTPKDLNALEIELKKLYDISPIFRELTVNRILRGQNRPDPYFCIHPENGVTINPQGKLFFCHRLTPKSYMMTEEFSNYYGDIFSGYYNSEYFTSQKELNIQSNIPYEECKICPYLSICRMNCRAVHFNSKKLNTILCAYIKIIISLAQNKTCPHTNCSI